MNKNRKTLKMPVRYLMNAVLVVLLFLALSYMTGNMLSTYQNKVLMTVGINIILAVSLNVATGYLGQLPLGHAGFMAVGAYVSAIVTMKLGLPFIVAIMAGACAAGLLGLLIGLPTLRLSGDYLAIATLGLGEIIRITILNINYIGGASGFMGIPRYTNFAWVFFVCLFVLFFIKNFINSSHGRACISIRENEVAAEAMGIDTTKYKVLAFTLGAAFAGVAGALFAHYFYVIHPASFTFISSFNYLTMVVLGGLGSITGSIAGAVILTFISAALASWPEWRMIIYSVMLIILMLYRPQGLFGNIELVNMNIFKRFKGGDK